MNILSTLPLVNDNAEVELTPEQVAEQEKAERKSFHRDKVRNGPVRFTFMTSGQMRRAKARDEARAAKKRWRKQKQNFFANQRAAAILRPHLQVVGLIPFIDGHTASETEQIVSTAWIVQRYGSEDKARPGHASFLRADVLAALSGAAKFYETVTGRVTSVPADYEPAIFLAVD